MLEQSVSRHDWRSEKRWRSWYRAIQITLLVLFIFGEMLGLTLASVFFEIDQALFWQRVFMVVILGLPMLIVVLLLQVLIRRRSLEYDYELFGNTFTVYRIYGNRRKEYLSFGLDTVTDVKRVADNQDVTKIKNALKSCIFASCNPHDPRLTIVWTKRCAFKQTYRNTSVLLEPDNALFERLQKGAGKK